MSVWGGTERRATGMVGGTVLTGAAALVAGAGRSPGCWRRGCGYLVDDLPDAVPDCEVGSRDEEQAGADRRLAAGSVPAVSSGSPLRSRT